jgi:hypothetical protein
VYLGPLLDIVCIAVYFFSVDIPVNSSVDLMSFILSLKCVY